MICTNCKSELPEGQKFCSKCGTSLDMVGVECSSCNGLNAADSNFCGNCGALLTIKATGVLSEAGLDISSEEERKLTTIMFADVHGFTAMSEKLDPEQVKGFMNRCFHRLTMLIEKYGGFVDKYMGDGLMAIFGAPLSHEDDEERAVRAALEMHQALSRFSDEVQETLQAPLSMRIGINTGRAMAGQIGSESNASYTVMGDAVNLASRLEHAAPTEGTLISDSTYQPIRHLVTVNTLSPIRVKGRQDRVTVHTVTAIQRHTHLELNLDHYSPSFYNRNDELTTLHDFFEAVQTTQQPHAIHLEGRPQIGKTHLLAEYLETHAAAYSTATFFYSQTRHYQQKKPFAVWGDLLRHFFDIRADDDPQDQQNLLLYGLAEYVWYHHRLPLTEIQLPLTLPKSNLIMKRLSEPQQDTIELAYYLAAMMDIPFEDSHLAPKSYRTLKEQAQSTGEPALAKQQDELMTAIHKAMRRFVEYLYESTGAPIYVIVDQLEWCDAESRRLLAELPPTLTDISLGVVLLSRESLSKIPFTFAADLACQHLKIELFTVEESAALCRHHLVAHHSIDAETAIKVALPPLLVDHLYTLTAGNPGLLSQLLASYLAADLLHFQQESRRWQFDHIAAQNHPLPQPIIKLGQAQLDQMQLNQKMLLQKAAIIGPVFWEDMLFHFDKLCGNMNCEEVLHSLVDNGVILPQSATTIPDQKEYRFNTPLYQKVVVETVPRTVRKKLHAEVATWLIDKGLNQAPDFFETIARHLLESGQSDQAYHYLLKAGKNALTHEELPTAARLFQDTLQTIPKNDANRDEKRSVLFELLGDTYALEEDFERLTRYYQKALDSAFILENIHRPDTPDPQTYRYANLERKLANVLRIQGRLADAQERINHALQLLGSEEVSVERVNIYLFLTELHKDQGDFDNYEKYANAALELANQLQNDSLSWKCCDTLGDCLRSKQEFTQAIKHYNFAYKGRKNADDMIGLAYSVRHLGITTLYQGDADKGIEYLKKSVQFFENLNRSRELGHSLDTLGRYLYETGKYDSAIRCFQRAQSSRHNPHNPFYQAGYFYRLSKAQFGLGEIKPSYDSLQKGLSHAENLGHEPLIIRYSIWICKTCTHLGYHAKALNTIEMTIERSRQLGLRPLLIRALLQQAESHRTMSYRQSALNSCLKALEMIEKYDVVEDYKLRGHALRILGDIYTDFNTPAYDAKALTCYQESIDLLKKVVTPLFLGRSYGQLGLLFQRQGDEQAATYLQNARDIFSRIHARHELAQLEQKRTASETPSAA